MATGATAVFLMAARFSPSLWVALAIAFLSVLTTPRAYDYDKVLFYPLGMLVCWRYLERQRPVDLLALALTIVIAGLFRYDNGIYILFAAVVGITVLHAGAWRTVARRLAVLVLLVVAFALPVLLAVQLYAGASDALDQVITYALREGGRTRLRAWPELDVGGWLKGDRDAAATFLFYVFTALPLAATLALLRAPASRNGHLQERACVAALIACCLAVDLFILRAPLSARIGGMCGPVLVLGLWVALRTWSAGTAARTAVVSALALSVWSVSIVAEWERLVARETFRLSRHVDFVTLMATSPPALQAISFPSQAIAAYVRDCTDPADRLFAPWFAPQLYYFAQRGFAGGMVVTFGEHWSEPRFQERIVRTLASQRVPVAIVDVSQADHFLRHYPLVSGYLQEHYELVGDTDFGHPDEGARYRVWKDLDRRPVARYPGSELPCFTAAASR